MSTTGLKRSGATRGELRGEHPAQAVTDERAPSETDRVEEVQVVRDCVLQVPEVLLAARTTTAGVRGR